MKKLRNAQTRADSMVIKSLLCVIIAAAVVAMLTACNKAELADITPPQSENTDTVVTLSFSQLDIQPMGVRTRGTLASIEMKHLDVWLSDGTTMQDLHQVSTDDGFGSLSVTLNKTKTYTLYAVAHKSDHPATLTDGVISFTDDKVKDTFWYTATFSPATTTSLACAMTRIVAQFNFTIADDIPSECKKLRFTFSNVYDRWNITSGATHLLDKVADVNYGGMYSAFVVYVIATGSETTHTITVTALDADNEPIQSRTFADVPLRNGYKTKYKGTFFIDSDMSLTFSAADWNEYDETTF